MELTANATFSLIFVMKHPLPKIAILVSTYSESVGTVKARRTIPGLEKDFPEIYKITLSTEQDNELVFAVYTPSKPFDLMSIS